MIFILAALGSVPLVGALLVLVVARQWVMLISLSALCVLLAGIPAIYAAVGYDPSGTSEPVSRSGTVLLLASMGLALAEVIVLAATAVFLLTRTQRSAEGE